MIPKAVYMGDAIDGRTVTYYTFLLHLPINPALITPALISSAPRTSATRSAPGLCAPLGAPPGAGRRLRGDRRGDTGRAAAHGRGHQPSQSPKS